MFDGPRALVKERDACGVGFIANTQSGGEFFSARNCGEKGLPYQRCETTDPSCLLSRGISLFHLMQMNLVHIKFFKTAFPHSVAWSTVEPVAVMEFPETALGS